MFRKNYPPIGSHPGTLSVAEDSVQTKIRIIDYLPDSMNEKVVFDVETLEAFRDSKSITWVDIEGLKDHQMLARLAEIFGIHPLTLADIVNVPSSPKFETHENYLLFITAIVKASSPTELQTEQVGIVFGKNFVISFQERHGDDLSPVRERIHQNKGVIRKMGSDYLAHAIIDTILDGYFPVLGLLGEHLEEIEDQILENPQKESLESLYTVRRELLTLRRLLWPQRDAINMLSREEGPLIKKNVKIYIRDLYDHCVQLIDVTETYRELCSGLNDVYLSSLSNRLNEVMKFLAAISTVFMPLTFLCGVYGMNFQHMPELEPWWAYPAWWVVTALITAIMVYAFKKRGWL